MMTMVTLEWQDFRLCQRGSFGQKWQMMCTYICHRLEIPVMENMTGFLHSKRKQ